MFHVFNMTNCLCRNIKNFLQSLFAWNSFPSAEKARLCEEENEVKNHLKDS